MSKRGWIAGSVFSALLLGIGIWYALAGFPASSDPSSSTAPQRIASLTLATDEILSELVTPERIVCVSALADNAGISNVPNFFPPRIPRLRGADLERIISLNPDFVCVASYNSADFLKVLERSGFPYYRNEALHSMDEIESGIIELGKRVGEPMRADELVQRMRERRRRLAEKVREVAHRPRVLCWSAGFTAGSKTTLDDIIREAGGVNVATEKGLQGWPEISPEQVISADPDFVLVSALSPDEREGSIENHPLLRNLRAVREKRVIAIEEKYLMSVSHFVLEGAERLAVVLHPDR